MSYSIKESSVTMTTQWPMMAAPTNANWPAVGMVFAGVTASPGKRASKHVMMATAMMLMPA